jgi:hypothetical protein
MAEQVETLGHAYPKEQARCRELLAVYRSLPDGVGMFGAAMLEQILQEADAAAMSGDIVRMLQAFNAMQESK